MRQFQSPGRSTVHALNGLCATSHPLAAVTAIEVLKGGGNAVDAALAASAVLCVAEPAMTGVGGDCFVLYAPAGKPLTGLNGSGPAPLALDAETLRGRGFDSVPDNDPSAITIPGAVGAWEALAEAYGSRPLADLLAPAIRYAEQGVAVAPRVAYDWDRMAPDLTDPGARALLLPGGRPPRAGDRWRCQPLADTLRAIAHDGAAAFYQGAVTERMLATLRTLGGVHSADDFAGYRPEWVEPLQSEYRGYTVAELPPNGHGVTAQLLLNILAGFDLAALDPDGVERHHLLTEASKLAYAARDRLIGDPRHVDVPLNEFLSPEAAARLRARIDPRQAGAATPAPPLAPTGRDTVYLCVVDADLNACSFINSLYSGFGSKLACPDSGVWFHNRGAGFSLQPDHPNELRGGRRPLHTIIPGMLLRDGRAVAPFGVMGGAYQPVGHAQLLGNVLDYHMDPQQALDGARSFWHGGNRQLELEFGIRDGVERGLRALGHDTARCAHPLGGGQMIWIDHQRGTLCGGSDPRKDGCALGY